MAYSLQLSEHVRNYLRQAPDLPRHVRNALFLHMDVSLRQSGDNYRNNPDLRMSPGSPFFRLDVYITDPDSGRRRRFWFIVNDASAPYGILRLEWVDEDAEP